MQKIIIVLALLSSQICLQAYPGYESDRQQRNWMMNTIYTPPASSPVSGPSIDYNKIFSYTFYNCSSSLISKIRFQHATSNSVTDVDTSEHAPQVRQQYKVNFNIEGVRNGAKNKWEFTGGGDVFQITVPVNGVKSGYCLGTSGSVYIQIIWANGTAKTYLLPYPCGLVKIYDNSMYVCLGISGKNMKMCDQVLSPL
ncbi:MAG: hypothetical protein E7044_12400 [Lentisphaerae bacterium]|nr:hypothetical protein [Lentisphaerota bacterium]